MNVAQARKLLDLASPTDILVCRGPDHTLLDVYFNFEKGQEHSKTGRIDERGSDSTPLQPGFKEISVIVVEVT